MHAADKIFVLEQENYWTRKHADLLEEKVCIMLCGTTNREENKSYQMQKKALLAFEFL
jgi:hypothetical protein